MPTDAGAPAPEKGWLDQAAGILRQAGRFTQESLAKGVGLLLTFTVSYAAARVVAVGAFSVDFLPLEILALIVLAAATGVGVWWAFGTERIQNRRRLGRAAPLGAALATLGFAVGTFSAATTLLYDYGHLDLSGSRLERIADDPDSADSIIGISADFYLWHLLDSVPLLDIADTIRWNKPYEYSDSLSGWLLLAFKGFVILPLIQVVRLIFARREAPETPTSRRA
jgi:hypothetical protein